MSKIVELFGHYNAAQVDWQQVAIEQQCPFLGRKCIKIRKSQPEISIGTCTVQYGKKEQQVVICPHRFRERQQVFLDCIHLLTQHEPGNELHLVSEVAVPGGSVDYFLVSSFKRRVCDFVGIELQTLDTTGTVWPERQKFLREHSLEVGDNLANLPKSFGMNWKMTAKTILVQLHHKIQTFEHLNKHFVLVIQNVFADYMKREFNFSHIDTVRLGDPMHFHSYELVLSDEELKIQLAERFSTDTDGIGKCLGLQAEARIELEVIIKQLEIKISDRTLFRIAG